MNRTTILASLIGALPLTLCAQTTHFVDAGGSSLGPAPYFAPNVLTIQVGDIVTWTNVGGTHNVNGSLQYYPTNPEGFVNGTPSNESWTFSRTFTLAGVYNYMCSTEGHSATQTGRIFVLDANTVPESTADTPFTLTSTSTTDHLFVGTGNRSIDHFEVLGLDGRQLANHPGSRSHLAQIPVNGLPIGNYLLRIIETSGRATTLRFNKN